MVKVAVDVRHDSHEELQRLLRAWWPEETLVGSSVLRGGFSATNYMVTTATQRVAVLKVCNSYSRQEVEEQAACQAQLARCASEEQKVCTAYPLAVSPDDAQGLALPAMYTCLTHDGVPAVLVTFVRGRAADRLIEEGVVNDGDMMFAIGQQMAALHSVPLDSPSQKQRPLRSYHDAGCCLLGGHYSGKFLRLFTEQLPHHPYVAFYQQRQPQVVRLLGDQKVPLGIVHGDAFLDNVLVEHDDRGAITSCVLVDYEDVCVGPIVFDLACCAIGCCFSAADNQLQLHRLHRLLEGYRKTREMEQCEKDVFVDFMRVALLCNASWRFMNFNIDHPELRETHGDQYKELQDRIEQLEKPDVVQSVRALLLASAKP